MLRRSSLYTVRVYLFVVMCDANISQSATRLPATFLHVRFHFLNLIGGEEMQRQLALGPEM